LNTDGEAAIARSLATERLCLRGAEPDDAPAVNAAILASWTERSSWMEWAQGVKPTIQDTIDQIDRREADFESRSEFRFSAKYPARADVFRFALELGHCAKQRALRIWAIPGLMHCGKTVGLFDHLVGASHEHPRNSEAKRLRSLEIDD
jgi:hypothetical protein